MTFHAGVAVSARRGRPYAGLVAVSWFWMK
jgi:hypothetical protein